MKALVKREAKVGLWLEDVPEPTVGINDVLIKVDRTGICGTDLHIYNWDAWAQKTIPVPMVVGHEFVGEVVDIGSNVKGFAPGDIVSAEGHIVCGHCRNCLAGRRHQCKNTRGIGVNIPGAFAEYIAVPMTNLWHIDEGIPLDVASIFDPLGNATHTALTFRTFGEDVLVTGAGPIGIMAAAVAQHTGARHVVITDMNPYRLELARKMGIEHVIDINQHNIPEIQQQLGMKEGFDVGMEMSGNSNALRGMIASMTHGGKIAILGIPGEDTAIDWNTLIFNMLTIKGIYGRQMYETWYMMSIMVQNGLDVMPIITHRYHYTDFQQGFDVMNSGMSGKVVLSWKD
jgi:threonine 3-dehydrogenase